MELTEAQMDAEEKRRAEQVISLALEACAKTKDSTEKSLLFNNAVHYLAGARTTLAIFGDHDQVRLLGEEAEMLFKRDPKSFGAVELQIRLVECLAELAEQEGRKGAAWGPMAAKQARLFASRFPQETNRSALALVVAARACEVGGRFDDAKYCFGVLERDFAKTPFAEQAAGAIRRYKLAGQPLTEFAGATIEGGFLSLDQLKGKSVLIVFWSAESPSFREDLPRLKQLVASQSDRTLSVVGVNMDVDEAVVDAFLEQAELPWRTIFFSNVDQRGIRNPLARAYGVTTVPQYWLVDARGTVVAAPVDLKSLSTKFSQLAEQGGGGAQRR
ncbi:MAG: TlpA family protein disulfide reductase [Gemmataceae bacterium]|nr:TlpA family protein disulfide reductase [Gemmataceae bacterium]